MAKPSKVGRTTKDSGRRSAFTSKRMSCVLLSGIEQRIEYTLKESLLAVGKSRVVFECAQIILSPSHSQIHISCHSLLYSSLPRYFPHTSVVKG